MTLTPTEKLAAFAKANAFAISMHKITGHKPLVTDYGEYVEVSFPDDVRSGTIEYLDRTVSGIFQKLFKPVPTDEELPDVQIRFGEVIIPWSIRYLAPAMVGLLALGYFAGRAK